MLIGAGAAVLVGATAFTVWSQSNVNEKVYTISLLVVAAVSWMVLRWRDLPAGDVRGQRLLVAAVYLTGARRDESSDVGAAGGGVPGLHRGHARRTASCSRLSLGGLFLAVVVGLSFNFILPLRAAERPVINEADPLCDGFVETAVGHLHQRRRPDAPRWPPPCAGTSTPSRR